MYARTLFLSVAFSFSTLAQASIIDTTPGLAYHLDAAINVTRTGNAVTSWGDVNNNGVVFSRSSPSKDPTFVASSSAFNNLPVISFNGDLTNNSNGEAPNASGLLENTSSTAQTVFIVEVPNTSNGLAGIWGQDQGDAGIRRTDTSTWQTQTTGNGNDFPSSMLINGVATQTQNNGTVAIMTAIGNANFTANIGDYFHVGANTPRSFGGEIAEMAVYNTVLTPAQQQAIVSFLESKYSVPEPGTFVLCGLGAVGLFAAVRRQRRGH
jgi:hypothetical protein